MTDTRPVSLTPNTDSNCARRTTEQELIELRLLYDIGTILAETLDVKEVLTDVLATIARHIGILRGTITILNRNNDDIAIEEAWGYDAKEIERGHYRPGEGITGRVIETGTPIVVQRIADEPLFLDRTRARQGLNTHDMSFVCVPIKSGSEIIGAIGVDLPHSTQAALNSFVRLFLIIAMSISQAVRLRQMTQEELERLKTENLRLQDELTTRYKPDNVIGNSKIMRVLYREIERVRGTNATVLLLGESGVGKEKIAHAIHYGSPRAGKPFIKVNCAAIPENLIESELFGHEKGAFTDAVSLRKGRFENADCGSIFLDEIGEMPLGAQSKFLRVLQEREFERVGGTETIHVNIRVIAATNRDLPELIKQGKFREDLYYRLNVFPLVVPPLRERKTDILLLANHFAEKFSKEHGKEIRSIATEAITLLMEYDWPGNVRELENCVERAVILADGGTIHAYHLPPSIHSVERGQPERSGSLTEMTESFERAIIKEALERNGGNVAKTAEGLGVTERIMGLRVAKYGLRDKGRP
ncbi:MAG TPA: sigma 54-interacting transcriptional regulator [Treponemataceae bacterium]|nr:sigma 54-interacting transcriptional regulator [Treponemataceae bacterium]HPS43207.1 sigma 54-interacting transcriptional regulator [Treponemataceae bacterium]